MTDTLKTMPPRARRDPSDWSFRVADDVHGLKVYVYKGSELITRTDTTDAAQQFIDRQPVAADSE